MMVNLIYTHTKQLQQLNNITTMIKLGGLVSLKPINEADYVHVGYGKYKEKGKKKKKNGKKTIVKEGSIEKEEPEDWNVFDLEEEPLKPLHHPASIRVGVKVEHTSSRGVVVRTEHGTEVDGTDNLAVNLRFT